jgi:flagellar basal body-associated protein FliL
MTQSSANTGKPKHSRKALVSLALVLVVIIVVGVLVSTWPSLLKTTSTFQDTVIAPKIEILSTTLRAAPVEEHLAYVNIKSQESMNLTLTFSDVTFSDFSKVYAYAWIQIPEGDSDTHYVMQHNIRIVDNVIA